MQSPTRLESGRPAGGRGRDRPAGEPPGQYALLQQSEWDVLIIVDACRADVFQRLVGRGETVLSPANCTAVWIHRVGRFLESVQPVYFTANPVVDREAEKRGLRIELVSLWKDHWGRMTEFRIPSLSPWAVNGAVLSYAGLGKLDGRRVVVHYLQPHSPYVGSVPLAMTRWGARAGPSGHCDGLTAACQGLPEPDIAAARGELDWDLLRAAYRANLALVWNCARQLAQQMKGRVIVTSDHGEILGEYGGQFGHEIRWHYPELYEVPWLVMDRQPAEHMDTREKLAALGYV